MDHDERAQSRADNPLPEEESVGIANAEAQAEAILTESDRRQDDRNAAPDTTLEHRTSEESTPPPD
jgi:hypothetical protein